MDTLRSSILVISGILIGSVSSVSLNRLSEGNTPAEAKVESSPTRVPLIVDKESFTPNQELIESLRLDSVLEYPSEFQQTLRLYELAYKADLNELEQLISQAFNLQRLDDRRGALYILVARYAELDPHGALALVSEPRFQFDKSAERAIWRGWIETDFEEAIATAAKLESAEQRERAANQIYNAIGLGDPAAARRVEEVLGVPPSRGALFDHARKLSMSSPLEAILYVNNVSHVETQIQLAVRLGTLHADMFPQQYTQLAKEITSSLGRQEYLKAAIQRLTVVAPEMAVSDMLADQSRGADLNTLKIAFKQLTRTDLDKATAYWQQIEDTETRLTMGKIIIDQLSQTGIESALNWAEQMEAAGNKGLMHKAIESFAVSDPMAALDLIDRYDFGEHGLQARISVIGALALVDSDLATQKFRELPITKKRNEALTSMLRQLFPQASSVALTLLIDNVDQLNDKQLREISWYVNYVAPEQAATALEAISTSTSLNKYLATQLFNKATSDIKNEQLLGFVSRYEGTSIHQTLLEQSAVKFVRIDPEISLSLAQNLDAGKSKDDILFSVTQYLAGENPVRAKMILNQISNSETQGFASMVVARELGKSDISSALKWANDIEENNVRDSALMALIPLAKNTEVNDLISNISDASSRRYAVTSHIGRLARKDIDAAREFLKETDLSDAWRSVYQELLDECYPANSQSDEGLNSGPIGMCGLLRRYGYTH